MTIFLILLAIWVFIGMLVAIPGVSLIWTNYEINGFSLKLALIILLLGPFIWLSTIGVLIVLLLDDLLH